MKTNNLLAPIVLALFTFARAMFAQDYLLPIGSSIDHRTNSVSIQFHGGPNFATDRFLYDPGMGNFMEVVQARARQLAKSFGPLAGYEDMFGYSFFVDANHGHYSTEFAFEKTGSGYVVPDNLFNFRLRYGAASKWYLPGITAIDMDVETSAGSQHFSSREGTGGSYCFLSAQTGSFEVGWALINNEYAVPWLQAETGVLEGSTVTLWQDDRYATFSMLDGSFVGSSDELPDFMPYLLRPTVQPKVTGLRLRDGLAEISISTGTARYFVVEHSTSLSTNSVWNIVVFAENKDFLVLHNVGQTETGFYRVRVKTNDPVP